MPLEIPYWIDRPLAFLRRKKFRHHRFQFIFGLRASAVPPQDMKAYRRVGRMYAEVKPRWVRGISREWGFLTNALVARLRRDTFVFEIGKPFLMGRRAWICTDVGTRTICAVRLKELAEDDIGGPPYDIEEHVIDRYSMDDCYKLP